jgi:hypothetical protein
VAAFYLDAYPIAQRLMWDQSETLETFGIERDLVHAGVPTEGIQPLLEAMRSNVKYLNQIRVQILAATQMTQSSRADVR